MTQLKFYTLPPSQSILSNLADFLLSRNRHNPFLLSSMHIILPTRRSVRKLKQLLLSHIQNSTLLLPKIQAINDLTPPLKADIQPEMPSVLRLGLLLKLLKAEKAQLDIYPSVDLAQRLCSLLDQIQLEEADLTKLALLVPEQFAQHWQLSLDFLNLLQQKWPAFIKHYGYLEPYTYRGMIWDKTAKLWQHSIPIHPIIAAGIMGDVPAVGRLLKCIAALPQGQVILPGFDLALTHEDWQSIKPSHPQFPYKRFFEREDIDPKTVQPWLQAKFYPTPRDLTLTALMKKDLSQKIASASGIQFIELETAQAEAECVSLIIREKLALAEQTIAVVSPDRQFNKRLRMELQRWKIDIDDSAGIPLTETALGRLLLQTSELKDFEEDPTDTIALLKHPFITLGYTRHELLRLVRTLESQVLRAPKEPSDLSTSLRDRISYRCSVQQKSNLIELVDRWKQVTTVFSNLQKRYEVPFKIILETHLTLLEQLSSRNTLWDSEAGQALVPQLQTLMSHAESFGNITPKEYQHFIRALLSNISLHEPFSHPRVQLLGPIEARLIEADLVILSNVNEGTWPTTHSTNPWLNRSMQRAIGLPDPETQIGQAALDFILALGNKNVIITRAIRSSGTLTTPSRWLLRLKTLAACNHENISYSGPVHLLRQLLDQPMYDLKISQPAPSPPLSLRPLKLSISDIDLLVKDAYAFYAKNILKLSPLDQMEVMLTPTLFGIWMHRILQNYPTAKSLSQYKIEKNVDTLWAYQFDTIKEWLLGQEEFDLLPEQLLTEKRLTSQWHNLEIIGKADRIQLKPGGIAIIDYKTGSLPTQQELKAGLAPQLPLLAMLAQNCLNHQILQLAYWDLKNQEIRTLDEPGSVITYYKQILEPLLENYLKTEFCFNSPIVKGERHSPYQHLKRAQEWLDNIN